MVPYFMQNNSEVTAIDLLLEVDKLEIILKFVSPSNFCRIVAYINSCALYGVDQQEMNKTFTISLLFLLGFKICLSQKQYAGALRLAMKLNTMSMIEETVKAC